MSALTRSVPTRPLVSRLYVLEYARLAALPPKFGSPVVGGQPDPIAPIAASQRGDLLGVHAVDLHAAKDKAEVAVVDLVSLGPVAWWLQVEAGCAALRRDTGGTRNPSAADSPATKPNRT